MEQREYQRLLSADCRCPVPPGDHRSSPASADMEGRYQAARARLLAAQQEKMEATVEFLAARAAVRRCLEMIWPSENESPDWELAAGV